MYLHLESESQVHKTEDLVPEAVLELAPSIFLQERPELRVQVKDPVVENNFTQISSYPQKMNNKLINDDKL